MRKSLVLTAHARAVMVEWQLNADWIERTVDNPDWIEKEDNGVERRFRSIAEAENRVLRVACLDSGEQIRIVTAFFDRKAKRPR